MRRRAGWNAAATARVAPALQPGEGRMPRDMLWNRRAGGEPVKGTGPQLQRPPPDDGPCPTGGGSGSLASRSAVLAREHYSLPCRREGGERGSCHRIVI